MRPRSPPRRGCSSSPTTWSASATASPTSARTSSTWSLVRSRNSINMIANQAQKEARRTILVVEDDAALRDTVAYNLRGEGYLVLTAADGVAALEVARQQPVALVLLDLMLPRLDGLDVCRQLRARAETAHTSILMLTARGEETDKVVGLEMGADDYVTKPFSWKELRARVRALLRRGEQGPAGRPSG